MRLPLAAATVLAVAVVAASPVMAGHHGNGGGSTKNLHSDAQKLSNDLAATADATAQATKDAIKVAKNKIHDIIDSIF